MHFYYADMLWAGFKENIHNSAVGLFYKWKHKTQFPSTV